MKDWPRKIYIENLVGFEHFIKDGKKSVGNSFNPKTPEKFPCIITCVKVIHDWNEMGAKLSYTDYELTYVYMSDFKNNIN